MQATGFVNRFGNYFLLERMMARAELIEPDEIGEIIRSAKALAKRYRAITGRPLGITGEVSEYEAARLLGLELATVRQVGYAR